MERTDSSRSFRDNYQEYILLQQKSSVLVDEYHERKAYSDTRAAEGKRCLEHTKQLLHDIAEFVPLEGALSTVRESISDLNQHHTDQNPYSSTILELRKLDAKYDFDSLTSETPVPHGLLHAVQQHKKVLAAMPRKFDATAAVQHSWSVTPSFCNMDRTAVADMRSINSFSDQELGVQAKRHHHASRAGLAEVEDSINWVSFLQQREQFYTSSTRLEMAAKVEADKHRKRGQEEEDESLLAHHLRCEDGGTELEAEGAAEGAAGVSTSLPEAQRVLNQALGEVAPEELLSALYRQHLELQLPNPQRQADNVDESEHVSTLSGVIVDHFMRSVSHRISEAQQRAASVYEVTVKQGAVQRIQCLFRQRRAMKKLNSLRAQKRVMDALQVLMSELGRTDVKSLSIAQADIHAMEKVVSTGGLGMGLGGGGAAAASGAKRDSSPGGSSGGLRSGSPSPGRSMLDFKYSSSPYSSHGSAAKSHYSSPASTGKPRTPVSGGIYASAGKSPKDRDTYEEYKRSGSGGLPPSGSSSSSSSASKTPGSSSSSCATPNTSWSMGSSSSSGQRSDVSGATDDGTQHLGGGGSNTSSQLIITTALNTQANSNLALPLEIMSTNFVSPKHATNVMANVPTPVPAPDTAIMPSKGILFASPLTEEQAVSSAPVGGRGAAVGGGVALTGSGLALDAAAAPKTTGATITTGRNGALIITSPGVQSQQSASSKSHSLAMSTISSSIEIEIPRGRTYSEQNDLQGDSAAPSEAASPRDAEQKPQRLSEAAGVHSRYNGRDRK